MARQCTVRTHASGVTAAYLLSKPKRNEINFQGESGKKSEVKIPAKKKIVKIPLQKLLYIQN